MITVVVLVVVIIVVIVTKISACVRSNISLNYYILIECIVYCINTFIDMFKCLMTAVKHIISRLKNFSFFLFNILNCSKPAQSTCFLIFSFVRFIFLTHRIHLCVHYPCLRSSHSVQNQIDQKILTVISFLSALLHVLMFRIMIAGQDEI